MGGNFHKLESLNYNGISETLYGTLQKELQIIDDSLSEVEIKQIMNKNPQIKFTEPQSMNYDKKVT